MEAVGNTASTSHVIIHALIRATQNAREFKNESKIYQLKLAILQRRLEHIRVINNASAIRDNEIIPKQQDRSLAQIITDIQHALSEAQQDSTKISRLQWIIYKRDDCYKSITDIDALVADLERLASNRR